MFARASLVCHCQDIICGFHMFLFPKMIFLPIHDHCYVFHVWICVFSLVTTSNMHNIRHITNHMNQNISILCSKYHCARYFQIIDLPQHKKKFKFFFHPNLFSEIQMASETSMYYSTFKQKCPLLQPYFEANSNSWYPIIIHIFIFYSNWLHVIILSSYV